MTAKVDIAVIGAGVVGCAIARHFKIKHPNFSVVVFEKAEGVGLETSRLNSGVIHSGIHENPDFLKSKLALIGSKMAVEFAADNDVPIINCGMLVVAGHKSLIGGMLKEWRSFVRLVSKAKAKGINYRFVWGRRGIRKLEPRVQALGGVFMPDVCVVDPYDFTKKLFADAWGRGVHFQFGNPVEKIERLEDCWQLGGAVASCRAKIVINAAGLYADDVAEMAGFTGYKIHPWRGEYYEVMGEKAKWINRLVYIATPPKSAGKGIHFGVKPGGKLFLGPSARLVPAKNYYTEDPTPVEVFLDAAQRFCPEIRKEDLRWSHSGIRPRLTVGEQEADFIIKLDSDSPPFVNLIGIESPGFTSGMAIAEYVENLVRDNF
ncbi:MAG: FAD-dependent oxidoreductase [bacterium]|nr:FAD-dependent oxidoreductase [bacterium]